MKVEQDNFLILDHCAEVAPLVSEVVHAADQARNALGFFPTSVFNDFSGRDQLFVCVSQHGSTRAYAGHLLFDARHPKAHVLQIFVDPSFRKRRVAKRLLDHLKTHLEEHAFISVYARVAEDLTEANKFWQAQNFYVQRVEPGGKTRKRTIVVRSHELNTPQLFASSGISNSNPLGLDFSSGAEIPLFLLDLNVLFDLGPRRRRNEDILDLFRAERMGSCQLALSTEINAELMRTATERRTDPMLAYARIFPTFPCPGDAEWNALADRLALIVFPARQRAGTLSANDVSDLRHLATAIHHRLTGIITNDTSILNAAARLKEEFDIQVISPVAFKDLNAVDAREEAFETATSDTVSLAPITATEDAVVHQLLSDLGLPGSTIVSAWGAVDSNQRVCVRQGAWCGEELAGYLMWPKPAPGNSINARIGVDETQPNALNATRALLHHLIKQATAAGTTQIKLEFPPCQAQIREVASKLGFGGTAGDASLTKVVLGRVVTQSNWTECNNALFVAGRLQLPTSMPAFRSVDQQLRIVRPDGNAIHVSLMALESLLSPAAFVLKGRPAVITPVRRDFAEHLLAHLPQKSLLPHPKTALYTEKHYLSGKQTLKHFKRGTLVLFYESAGSGGLGAVVALARVQHAYLKSEEAMERSDLDPSILDAAGLAAIGRSKIKTVTAFDNLICLDRPVALARLQSLGCGTPTQLLTTHKIDDSQLEAIVAEGFAHK